MAVCTFSAFGISFTKGIQFFLLGKVFVLKYKKFPENKVNLRFQPPLKYEFY